MMMEGVKDATLVTVMAMMSPTNAMDAAVVVLIVRTVFLGKGVMYRLVDSDVVTFLELSCMVLLFEQLYLQTMIQFIVVRMI